MIPVMRLSRVPLLVSTVAGALSVMAALFSARQTSSQCGVVALVALIGYVAVAGRAARPRVRWALVAGIGLLAVVIAVQLFWYPDQTGGGFGWFAYASANKAPSAMLGQWRRVLDGERISAVGRLLGVLCLAVAVLALPGRHRPKPAVSTTVLALLLLAVVGADSWSRLGSAPVVGLLGTVWPALLATFAGVGVAARAGWRADRFWLLPAGALLVAVAATIAFDDLAGTWLAWWAFSDVREGDTVFAVMDANSLPEVSGALATAVALVGPALLAIGALRASRDAGPVVE